MAHDEQTAPSFPPQRQEPPGLTGAMDPLPDHGERSYTGSGRLAGRRALITGGDSGIGRAVAIAFAREGADVALSYLPQEQPDADQTAAWVRDAGRTVALLPGDLTDEQVARSLPRRAAEELGGLDVLVNNAGFQTARRSSLADLETAELDRVMRTNLAAELGPRGIRVNAVAPGPIWTPLQPATQEPDHLAEFGKNTPLGRAGQPAEVAPAFVFLASQRDAGYVSGTVLGVTGGRPVF